MHRLLYLCSALALASEVPSAESLLDRFILVPAVEIAPDHPK